MLNLDIDAENITGVGSRTAAIMRKAGFLTMRQILEHYPYKYEDFSNIKQINKIKKDDTVTIKAKINDIKTRKSYKNRRLNMTEAILGDQTGNIQAIWFNQPYLATTLKKETEYYFSGNIALRSRLQIQNPQYEPVTGGNINTARIIPTYSLPEGIAVRRWRTIIHEILKSIPQNYDLLSKELKRTYELPDLGWSLRQIHFPDSWQSMEAAQRRLGFDELLLFHLQNLRRRQMLQSANAPVMTFNQPEIKEFAKDLPFKLTLSQKKCAWEIIQDLQKTRPMNRLLQGDVGSGKTVVAALAAYNAALAGFQTALLAPTEVLAQQHHQTLNALLKPKKVRVDLLTKSTRVNEKKSVYRAIKDGETKVLVGTHAIFNEQINFANLGLLVVDEQQRFGVNQRAVLARGSAFRPHLLSMTATPIPRTLALTLYGDLSISYLNEMPSGRKPITTEIKTAAQRAEAYAFMRKEILAGRQGFIVYPLIEESEFLDVRAAKMEHKRLSSEIFPNFSLGLIHGQMPGHEKEKIMQKFKDRVYHILVSTSVIEVGVDAPNATIMIIENAERFGLAQLHQFRGRVGRGQHPSFCFLIPSGNSIPERLHAVCKYNDGFRLAEIDLKLRGMGELTGVKQSGWLELKVADPSDLKMVKAARQAAEQIINDDLNKYPAIKNLVFAREKNMHPE